MLFSWRLVFATLASLSAYAGDKVEDAFEGGWGRAFADNATHAVVAFLTWLSIAHPQRHSVLLESLVCATLASLIDLDHFIAASSLHLSDAISLKRRPFLHCTSFLLVLVGTFLLTAHVFRAYCLRDFAYIVLAAALSHHTRDAWRRGFWVFPFGSTPPIPYIFYLILLGIIPYALSFCFEHGYSRKETMMNLITV